MPSFLEYVSITYYIICIYILYVCNINRYLFDKSEKYKEENKR